MLFRSQAGGLLWLGPALAARLLKTPGLSWQRLSFALAPLAAASIILGLSMLTVSHLKAEHVWLGWLPAFRIALLALGGLGSLWLALRLAWRAEAGIVHKASAGLAMLFPVTLMVVIWCLVFFIW